MKILTDFDGVLTDPTEEGKILLQTFRENLVSKAGLSAPEADRLLKQCQQTFSQNPHLYGWMSQGRISAFWNEDPFVYMNALGSHLDSIQKTDPLLKSANISSYATLVRDCFESIQKMYPLDEQAIEILVGLQKKGHDITIVSNSNPERIKRILGAYQDCFQVIGSAGKHALSPSKEGFSVNQYFVDTERPQFKTIIEKINPDILLGDVFCLDLALPSKMLPKSLKIIRKRPYTPQWSLEYIESLERFKIMNYFKDLLSFL